MRPRKGAGARGLPKNMPKLPRQGICESCGAKDVWLFKCDNELWCRYCSQIYHLDEENNDEENIALMFNVLEKALKGDVK